MKKRKTKIQTKGKMLRILQPNAAGIDVGSTEIYIAIPEDSSDEPIRCFETFTRDLHNAAKWLKQSGIESIAMESTGVYWIPVFQILESYGFDVFLVNARHVKTCQDENLMFRIANGFNISILLDYCVVLIGHPRKFAPLERCFVTVIAL